MMSQQPSRSLQLLDQLEMQLEHLVSLEADVQHLQALAEHRRQQLVHLERQAYPAAMHFAAERDGLRQERDAAYRELAQLVDLLLPLRNETDLVWDDLQSAVDSATQLLVDARFLDNANLDTSSLNDTT